MVCSNNWVNEKDGAVEFVFSDSASNKLSFLVFAGCVISSSWELAGSVTVFSVLFKELSFLPPADN